MSIETEAYTGVVGLLLLYDLETVIVAYRYLDANIFAVLPMHSGGILLVTVRSPNLVDLDLNRLIGLGYVLGAFAD